MSKIKTHKATTKRVKLTNPKKGKSPKVLTKKCGQAHFNAKESGKIKRLKRKAHTFSESYKKTIINLIQN